MCFDLQIVSRFLLLLPPKKRKKVPLSFPCCCCDENLHSLHLRDRITCMSVVLHEISEQLEEDLYLFLLQIERRGLESNNMIDSYTQEAKVLLQVLLKDFIAKFAGWSPNAHIADVEALIRSERKDVVKGCKFGHPQQFLFSLAEELTGLSQNVYYVLERELLSESDLQAKGGLRLLDALSLIMQSQYNQVVFLECGGLQSIGKIVRSAINQLHVCMTSANRSNEDSVQDVQDSKIDYLYSLLVHCMSVLSPCLGTDNIISKEYKNAGCAVHPLIHSNICSSQSVADYIELLQIIKSSTSASKRGLTVFKLQAFVLQIIKVAYEINNDTDLIDAGVVESMTSLIGDCKYFDEDDALSIEAFFNVKVKALEAIATASQKHAVIVQHFLQSDGVSKVHQWMLLILNFLRKGESGGKHVIEAAFHCLNMQITLCKENERYIEALLRGIFDLLSSEDNLIWKDQWQFLDSGTESNIQLALSLLELKKQILKWIAMLVLTSKHAITLLRRHKCWDVLMGRNFFKLCAECSDVMAGSVETKITVGNDDNVSISIESDRTRRSEVVMKQALECQAFVSSVLHKVITSSWNNVPEIEIKLLLKECHLLALQPGSCIQLLNVLRKYVNSFKSAKTAAVLDQSECSSGIARILQKQKSAKDDEWKVLSSDGSFLFGIFDENLDALSIPLRTRIHLLTVLKEVFGCHVSVQEYFIKQWNAVGALFSLIWEKTFQDIALDMVKDLLKMTPTNTDSEIAKSVLFTRYVEALPRAQVEIHKSGLKLVFLLLEGIQETINTDMKHQKLFNECETILHVFNLLNEDFSEEEGPELCSSVLKTLGYLISGNRQGRKHLQRTVGWDTLQELIFHCVTTPIPYSIFLELFNIATDQILNNEGKKTVHFVSVKLVPTMLNILKRCTQDNAKKGLSLVCSVLQGSIANCAACDYHGVSAQLFEWFRGCSEEEKDVQDCIINLIQTIGNVSLSAKDLRTILRTCYGVHSTTLDEVKLLQSVSILRNTVNQSGPTDFLDLDGVQSGLHWKGKSSWGGSKAYSFSAWLRFDTSNLHQSHGKVLYSLNGKTVKNDQYSVLVVLESHRILVHTVESKLHSVTLDTDVPIGSWFHLGVVHDNSSTFSSSSVCVYVNGVKKNIQRLKYPRNFDILTGISVGCLIDEESPHNMCRWLSRLKGQVSSIFLFQDALYEKHMMQIFRIGPNVAFNRLIKGFNTGDMLFLALKEKANAGGLLFNVVQPGAPIAMSVLEGTHFCCTRVMQDMIQCIGGIGVILTLFGQLYLKYVSKAQSSEVLSSVLTKLLELMEALINGSPFYMRDMMHMEGFPILGHLIKRADAKNMHPEMVGAIEKMLIGMLDRGDTKIPYHEAVRCILLDLNWWSNVSDTVQRPYIELLLRTLRTEYKAIRDDIGISHFLDAMRVQKGRFAYETNSLGEMICSDLLGRGNLESIIVLMEKKFDESDITALLSFINDNLHEDVTFMLLKRLNAYLKAEKPAHYRFIDMLSKVGGAGVLVPLLGSSNAFVCAEGVELLLLSSKRLLEDEELIMHKILLEEFGAKLSSLSFDKGLHQKLVSLLKIAKYPELYIVYVLFQVLSKGESAERKLVLTHSIKLLSKTRYSVEAFVRKAAWQRPLVGMIVDKFATLPSPDQLGLSKTRSENTADEVILSWNILISLLFYCVQYKDSGSLSVEYTICHFLWMQNFEKGYSTILFPQLIKDIFKMILLSDQVAKSTSESWTTVEALECEACVDNISKILPLCRDILSGTFLSSSSEKDEDEMVNYDAVQSIPSMGKSASAIELWKELGLESHVIHGADWKSSSPIHKDLGVEFCEVCLSVIFKLCFGSDRSAYCFMKYINKEGKEGAEQANIAEGSRSSHYSPRAMESLKPENVQCVFQVTMSLFTLMLNSDLEESRAKEITKDACSIIEYCIVSSHVPSKDLSVYVKAMEYAKESQDFSQVHRELCGHVHNSLSYGKQGDALESDIAKLKVNETLYRAGATQERMVRISSLQKQLEEIYSQNSKLRMEYAKEGRQRSRTISELDEKRRLDESMNLLERSQESERHWKILSRKLTSEKGIWASEKAQNLRWKLDSTEDFLRRRIKLRRLYTLRDYVTSSSLTEKKSDVSDEGQIIKNLPVNALKVSEEEDLQGELPSPSEIQDSQEFKEAGDGAKTSTERLRRSESIQFDATAFFAECKLVTAKRVVPGKIHVDNQTVYFSGKVQEESNLFGKGMPDPSFGKTKRVCINVQAIREIHFMRYMLEQNACEIFLQHKSFFVAFLSRDEMKKTVKHITMLQPSIHVVTRRKRLALAELYSSQWRKGEISNFNYLMKLNTLAGRTFNDLSQYPVFPWILADYESNELDLKDPSIYRDLSKPIGALNEKRKALVEERYNLTCESDDPAKAFHYGSHYSTAGIVLYYLIRTEPFTFLHSILQGGKLDHADRLFSSVSTTWTMCNNHSADVKELIPEFFCLPEMFDNINDIDFGTRQDGVHVSEVSLPPWAHGSSVEFVKIHRKALESDYVSSNLHSWIDLVFGFKQRGKAAVEAVNVFHYLSYEGSVDMAAIEDEHERKVVADHVLHFGQTPSQLFRKKQAARTVKSKKGFWTVEDMKMNLALIKGSSKTSIRHCSIVNGRIMTIDQDAFVHYYKWITPNLSTSFTFTASVSADFNIEFDKTSELLRKQYGSTLGQSNNHFAVLGKSNVLLSVGHWDNSIRCYNLDDMKCFQSVSCHKDAITCVAVGYEERVVVTGSRDTTVIVWTIGKAGKYSQATLQESPQHILYGHQNEVSCIAVSVTLDLVISASMDGDILFHTLEDGLYIRDAQLPNCSVPTKMIVNGFHGAICIYCQQDLKLYTMTVNGKILAATDIGERINSMSFTFEGQHILLGGEKGSIHVRDATSLEVKEILRSKNSPITNVIPTPEDCLVASNGEGEFILVSPESSMAKKSRSWN